jgi:hypothetical protein
VAQKAQLASRKLLQTVTGELALALKGQSRVRHSAQLAWRIVCSADTCSTDATMGISSKSETKINIKRSFCSQISYTHRHKPNFLRTNSYKQGHLTVREVEENKDSNEEKLFSFPNFVSLACFSLYY